MQKVLFPPSKLLLLQIRKNSYLHRECAPLEMGDKDDIGKH